MLIGSLEGLLAFRWLEEHATHLERCFLRSKGPAPICHANVVSWSLDELLKGLMTLAFQLKKRPCEAKFISRGKVCHVICFLRKLQSQDQ